MAYTTYEFYTNTYFGNSVPEDDFARLAERASDWVDTATFSRLTDALPTSETAQNRIQKAVCAIADVLYQSDMAQKLANAAAARADNSDGTTGTVSSRSSGSESVSYASLSESASGVSQWSAVYAAAGDPVKTNALVMNIARQYLNGVTTDEGVPLLYAGYC